MTRSIWIKYILLIAVLTFLAFGRITELNFGSDDYLGLSYLARGEILFEYPYYADMPRMWPLFSLFHLNPAPYYALAILLFFLSTLAFGLLAWVLSHRVLFVFVGSILYIFSSVGVGTMYTVSEAIRHTQYLILQLTTLALYVPVVREQKPIYYAASLLGFVITVFVFPYRAHTFIVLFFLAEMLLGNQRWSFGRSIGVIGRMVPFGILAVVIYAVIGPQFTSAMRQKLGFAPTIGASDIGFARSAVQDIAGIVLSQMRQGMMPQITLFFYLFFPTASVGSFAALNRLMGQLRIIYPAFFIGLVAAVLKMKDKTLRQTLLFLTGATLVVILGYSMVHVEYQNTLHRYLFMVRPFVALFLAGVFGYGLTKRRYALIFLGFVAVVSALQLAEFIRSQKTEVYYRGAFSKNIIAQIRKLIPTIDRYTFIFFESDTVTLDRMGGTFRNVGTPGWALTPYYQNKPEDVDVGDRTHCEVLRQIAAAAKDFDLYYFTVAEDGALTAGDKRNALVACDIPVY